MKVIFCADIHIKLSQKNVPKDWALNRLSLFIEKLEHICKEADVLILGGDTFDRLPSLEELEVYFHLISRIPIECYIIDGNHEATKKGHTFLSSLSTITSMLNSKVTIIDEVTELEFGTILPYCKLKMNKVFDNLNSDKALFTHVRGEIPPHVKPEIDLTKLDKFPVVYAGDLHSRSNSQRNIIYPGAPMTTSFHRNPTETGLISIDTDNLTHGFIPLDLPQLIRKTVTSEDEMVKTTYDHTIYEVEGNIESLSKVESSDILDKKIVRRSSEASLLLDSKMTMEDELAEYLMYILELDEKYTREVIGEYRDYITES